MSLARPLRILGIFSSFIWGACSSADPDAPLGTWNGGGQTGPGGANSDLGGRHEGGGGEASQGCGEHEHETDAGECDTTLSWSEDVALPTARDHHQTFAYGAGDAGFLYVSGGTADMMSVLDDLWMANINADGSLGEWEEGAPPPSKHSGAAVVQRDNLVYLLGGYSQRGVSIGTISSVGAIDWSEGPDLPASRFHTAGASVANYIYVVGGLASTQKAVDSVYRAEVQADGSLSDWEEDRPLPEERSHASVFAVDRWVYVVGGLSGNPAGSWKDHDDVFRAQVSEDGSLVEWESLETSPSRLMTHSNFLVGNWVYVAGGIEGGNVTDAVHRTTLGADGSLGAWEVVSPGLPIARGHVHQTPIWNGRVFSAGGSTDVDVMPHEVTNRVFTGTFQ